MRKVFFASILCFASTLGFAQLEKQSVNDLAGQSNVISTAVPFLTIAPDSRAGGMGEVGVATSPDVWSNHWNASKTAMNPKDMAIGVSYTPWLRNLGINDINLIYLTGFKKLKNSQAISGAVRYFSLGSITFTDSDGGTLGQAQPMESAVDLAYSRKLVPNFSVGIAMRYIYTNLTAGYSSAGTTTSAGMSVAADLSGYYRKELKNNLIYTAGFNISNLGAKIGYSSSGRRDFIPTNLRIGTGLKAEIDKYNSIAAYVDLSKLMVPTPPKYYRDASGVLRNYKDDSKADVKADLDAQSGISVPTGVFSSFSDAPGGFSEEMREVIVSIGAEYWYDKQFGLRAGYFGESETKGNRKFFTLGLGLRMSTFALDFSYLIPTNGKQSPLANTMRFSLSFEFEKSKKSEENSRIETSTPQ